MTMTFLNWIYTQHDLIYQGFMNVQCDHNKK